VGAVGIQFGCHPACEAVGPLPKECNVASQIVRQWFDLNQPGSLPSFAGGVRVTCSADFQLHLFAKNSSGQRDAPGLVMVAPIQDGAVNEIDGFFFDVPPSDKDVSLGCTVGAKGDVFVVRGIVIDHPTAKIKTAFILVTDAGATVKLDPEQVPATPPSKVDPINQPLPHRPK
jgi:hypothetical protein